MTNKSERRLAAIVAAALAGSAISAGAAVPAFSETDELLELGEYLAAECMSCHQLNSTANGVPSITGLPVEKFVKALKDYKQGARQNATMKNVAQSLTDEEMKALAIFYYQAEKKER